MQFPIYLDSNATTPVDPRVLKEMLPYFTEHFGNASSIDHSIGAEADEVVKNSRKRIAKCLNANYEEIVFTSGATESNNIVLQGLAQKNPDKNHIITCVTEHKSILDTCHYLEKIGKKVTYVPVDRYGIIDLDFLEKSITDQTALITVMTANNEIGTIAPIKEIGRIARSRSIPFHTDAAQAIGHIPFDVKNLNVDLVSFSAHKMYGPKGIGALFVNRNKVEAKPMPLFYGGGHEHGIRSGTLNVAGIVGMSKALEIAIKEMTYERDKFEKWTRLMLETFTDEAGPAEQNGHPDKRLSHNLNISFHGVENKALVSAVFGKLAISTGSACTTLNVEPSHVILSLGFARERADTAIRFGLSRFNTDEEIEFAAKLIVQSVNRLRKIRLDGKL